MIGIGGIGMSALARYFKSKGVSVTGSDHNMDSNTVKGLLEEGIEVIDQKKIDNYNVLKSIYNTDCIIYTLAIPPENLELKVAQAHELPIFTYAEMLGQISEDCFTIAVAGTHGKTTTTAMVAEIAKNLNLEANTIVGSFLYDSPGSGDKSGSQKSPSNNSDHSGNKILTNFVSGDSNLFVVEACEYKRSFLNLKPNILIITNLEADHLDYYKDLDDIKQAFFDLATKIPDDGKIICNVNDKNLKEICESFREKIVDYSKIIAEIPSLKVFGDYNRENAAAAICAISSYLNNKINEVNNIHNYENAEKFNFPHDDVVNAVKTFKGTWRRMEFKGTTKNGTLVYDDYAHHPTEIMATVSAFKENFSDKKIAVIFGPHLHSRTKMFFDEFVNALSLADHSVVYPIFKARKEEDFGISAELLMEKINATGGNATFSDSFNEIATMIEELDSEWVVILLGAGEVYKIAELLKLS